ncbi:MAG: LamG domain-containing protein [Deltaproteobacteria bacterium]|nr:LamG domain-containing protein [Deltaproteobacteria bacterium]
MARARRIRLPRLHTLACVALAMLASGCLVDRRPLGGEVEVDAAASVDAAIDANGGTLGRDAFVLSPDALAPIDAAQPPDAFAIDPGLVAWWPFASDDPTKDATGLGHTLTSVGVAFEGNVAMLDGGDQLHTPDAPDLDEIVTIAAWVRPLERRGHRMGVLDRDGIWGIFVQASGEPTCILHGNASLAGPSLPLDQWAHLACTYDGGTVRFSVNGSVIGASVGGAIVDNASRIQIGQNCCDGGDELRGHLSDVRLYRRALGDEELARIAASPPP